MINLKSISKLKKIPILLYIHKKQVYSTKVCHGASISSLFHNVLFFFKQVSISKSWPNEADLLIIEKIKPEPTKLLNHVIYIGNNCSAYTRTNSTINYLIRCSWSEWIRGNTKSLVCVITRLLENSQTLNENIETLKHTCTQKRYNLKWKHQCL